MIRSLRAWTLDRDQRRRAASYVAALCAEPAEEVVAWLSEHGTDCDTDHARWELRYARRALGLIAAQRDALDDRTASLVATELARSLANDPAIAPGKIRMAERQLNARLSAYGDALGNREGEGSGWHLGRTLLEFAGHRDAVRPNVVATAGDLLARYLGEANAALRKSFGAATLPG
ncbi:MAG TPA: hypothetical protein VLI43_17320 [Gemmatimonadaceae bacterium]|nr:hypothetical protein [Gemmatimonadaceae bacterium]